MSSIHRLKLKPFFAMSSIQTQLLLLILQFQKQIKTLTAVLNFKLQPSSFLVYEIQFKDPFDFTLIRIRRAHFTVNLIISRSPFPSEF
ncbi:hypothetical protein C5167_016392 [Papaver somniferum]|nr:hypothetical protein C5167_016392 [Papaver somniferum]